MCTCSLRALREHMDLLKGSNNSSSNNNHIIINKDLADRRLFRYFTKQKINSFSSIPVTSVYTGIYLV